MCHTAVMKLPGDFSQIEAFLREQSFHPVYFKGDDVLLNGIARYRGKQAGQIGIVIMEVVAEAYGYFFTGRIVRRIDKVKKISFDFINKQVFFTYEQFNSFLMQGNYKCIVLIWCQMEKLHFPDLSNMILETLLV